ncbi:MAG TPA: ABC transporter ATP-binding protein [Solibacterales bacterium]|nr:ABC transporter ATP-binding protein [Bryobacterales bacterium]
MVAADRLTHRYGERVALDTVTFAVPEGELFGVLGPNGGGKSTLFKILSTLMAPASGDARIGGFSLARQSREIRRLLGVVFQSQSLDRKLTVEENLRAQGHLFALSGRTLSGRIADALVALGLDDRRRDPVGTLSGGLQRRVEIAKALLHRPAVLLLDEPSTGLDPGARRDLWQYLGQLRAAFRLTILLTTHTLDEAERCDRLLLLHQGRIAAAGAPAELKARVGGEVVLLRAAHADQLAVEISERFSVQPRLSGGVLRVEVPDGQGFLAGVLAAFPGRIDGLEMHRPTLEDVFLDLTGATLDS